MEEIKVGDYVRTEFGNIGKFYRPASEGSDVYYIYINRDGNKISSRYDSIVKHSPNIIDIIEEGDYVNGEKVSNVDKYDNIYTIEWEYGNVYTTEIINDKFIKDIVTKEQFNQVKYEV